MGNLQRGEVLLNSLKYLDLVDKRLLIAPGDIVFNRTNSLDQVGKAAMFRGSDTPTSISSYLVRFRFTEAYDPEYANFVMGTEELLRLARTLALPSIGQANLNPARYATIPFPVPPKGEQQEIAERLIARTSELTNIENLISESIRGLGEYRAALIMAAVTGQLDPGAH